MQFIKDRFNYLFKSTKGLILVAIAMIEMLTTAVRSKSPLNDGNVILGMANNGAVAIAAVLAEPGSTIIEKT